MFVVYALFSSDHNRIYIGYTSNLLDRFLSHNKLATKGYTVKYRPWQVVYTDFFHSKQDALKREKELKSSRGRDFIRNEINRLNDIGLISVS
jgi:putative endonuclease